MAGATGATGADGLGAIIPFSSGTPVTLTSLVGGLVGLPAIIAFGDNLPLLTALGTEIDLTGLTDLSFMVPRDGTITEISVFFSLTAGIDLVGTTATVHAQLYGANPASNTLTEIAGTDVALAPGFTGLIAIGGTATVTQAVNVPVVAGTRLALVLFIEVEGIAIATALIGTASAGITIS